MLRVPMYTARAVISTKSAQVTEAPTAVDTGTTRKVLVSPTAGTETASEDRRDDLTPVRGLRWKRSLIFVRIRLFDSRRVVCMAEWSDFEFAVAGRRLPKTG